MTDQLRVALGRAFVGGLLTALLTWFTSMQALMGNPDRMEISLLTFGATMVGYVVARGVAEGWIDGNRASDGKVQSSDVGFSAVQQGTIVAIERDKTGNARVVPTAFGPTER